MILEVCVDSLESSVYADKGGADRIELCADLKLGGTTPSIGLAKLVREYVSCDVYAMIRPRDGDFAYNEHEILTMKEDIAELMPYVDGFVFGALKYEGVLDINVMSELIALTGEKGVTVHRAFDCTIDIYKAYDELKELGVDRVLTAGGYNKAYEGIKVIQKLVEIEGPTVMAGCGINSENVREIIEATGVTEVHLSAASTRSTKMRYQNPALKMGSDSDESSIRYCNIEKVRKMKSVLSNDKPPA